MGGGKAKGAWDLRRRRKRRGGEERGGKRRGKKRTPFSCWEHDDVTDDEMGPQGGDVGLSAECSRRAWNALDWEFCSKSSAELYSTAELNLDLTYLTSPKENLSNIRLMISLPRKCGKSHVLSLHANLSPFCLIASDISDKLRSLAVARCPGV